MPEKIKVEYFCENCDDIIRIIQPEDDKIIKFQWTGEDGNFEGFTISKAFTFESVQYLERSIYDKPWNDLYKKFTLEDIEDFTDVIKKVINYEG